MPNPAPENEDKKPANCTCRFPEIRVRRPICHEDGCPVQVEYERFMVEKNAIRRAAYEAEERKAALAAFEAFEPPWDRGIGIWDYFLAGWKARRKHDDEQIARHL